MVDVMDRLAYRELQDYHRSCLDEYEFPKDAEYEGYEEAFRTDWELFVNIGGHQWINHIHEMGSDYRQPLSEFLDEVKENDGKTVPDLELRKRYWNFLQKYPCHHDLPENAERHVEDVLSWCLADQVLFGTITPSFSEEKSQRLLEILKSLPELPERIFPDEKWASARAIRVWYISAIAGTITSDRIATGYGTAEARAFRDAAKLTNVTEFTYEDLESSGDWMFFVVSYAIFFGIPISRLKQIMDVGQRELQTGGITEARWRSFLESRLKDWSDSNLLATVMIAATVAFIAVPGIDDISRTLVLLSALMSIGSVLMGQYLVRIHEPHASSTAQTGVYYFQNVGSHERLAILLSLPMILISWSFVTFITAFVVFASRGEDGSSLSLPRHTTYAVAISTGILAVLLLGIVRVFRGVWKVTNEAPRRSVLSRISEKLLEKTSLLPFHRQED
ncbi:hypothetical protein SISNIDRAFT_489856 [Sistotremastrum niveocremeum HHB9708]|uniref:Uncharacterized protein n=1 Tax=Sistotremastrum niveocremeum HHB9708 TaxID=1314777 RepID=A0A164PKT6_9AGAM|nr:hypothetical protein SISNIDRAFT_489856 [Sistotremastrum niveocremeum HHB9708]